MDRSKPKPQTWLDLIEFLVIGDLTKDPAHNSLVEAYLNLYYPQKNNYLEQGKIELEAMGWDINKKHKKGDA